jgi:hypothetical protein
VLVQPIHEAQEKESGLQVTSSIFLSGSRSYSVFEMFAATLFSTLGARHLRIFPKRATASPVLVAPNLSVSCQTIQPSPRTDFWDDSSDNREAPERILVLPDGCE